MKNNPTLKQERFKRVATRRVQEILKKLTLLSNCANSSNYEYTEEQAKRITNVIDSEWKKVKLKFEQKLGGKREFKL